MIPLNSSPHIVSPSSGSFGQFQAWDAFVHMVLTLTVEAYQKMRTDRIAQLDWEEDTFSAALAEDYLTPLANIKDLPIRVHTQVVVYTNEMKRGKVSTKKARKIDIKLYSVWQRDYHKIYFAWECKRICDRQSSKTPPMRKNKNLIADYLKNGIKRFTDENYSAELEDAGILAYVLAGEIPQIVNDINKKMSSRKQNSWTKNDCLEVANSIDTFTDVYQSQHRRNTGNKIHLYHLYLSFDWAAPPSNG